MGGKIARSCFNCDGVKENIHRASLSAEAEMEIGFGCCTPLIKTYLGNAFLLIP